MKEIKTKKLVDAQEVFEGVTDLDDRVRQGLGRSGDYARNLAGDGQVSSEEYAADQLQYAAEDIGYEAGISRWTQPEVLPKTLVKPSIASGNIAEKGIAIPKNP